MLAFCKVLWKKEKKLQKMKKKAVCGGEDYNHSLLFNIVPFWCTNFSFSVRSLVLLACRLCCISFGEFHQITRNYWNCPRSLAHLQKRTNIWFYDCFGFKTKLLKVFHYLTKNNRCFAMVSGDRKTTRMICTSFLFPFLKSIHAVCILHLKTVESFSGAVGESLYLLKS